MSQTQDEKGLEQSISKENEKCRTNVGTDRKEISWYLRIDGIRGEGEVSRGDLEVWPAGCNCTKFRNREIKTGNFEQGDRKSGRLAFGLRAAPL